MPDVAFDSERHAQVSDDMSAGGGELTASAMSATVLAAAQLFGHWTTESAAQVMGEAVRSFLSSFATNMTNEAKFLNDLDTKVAQAVSDFTGTEEDARAAMAAVGTALLSLKLTSANKPKDEAAQSGEADGEQGASGEAQATPTYGAQSDI